MDTRVPAREPIAVVAEIAGDRPERRDRDRRVIREHLQMYRTQEVPTGPRRAHNVPKEFETASIAPLT